MTISGARPSATFRSTSPRFDERHAVVGATSPGPIYEAADPREIAVSIRNKRPSPAFRSTTPRFELGQKAAAPSIGTYDVLDRSWNRGGGASAFRSTTSRFPERKPETPEAVYDVVDPREIRASIKRGVSAPFRSRSERFYERPEPVVTTAGYLGPERPSDVGHLKDRRPSSAFKSTAPRFGQHAPAQSPGVGMYALPPSPFDEARAKGKGSAAFKSTAERFKPSVPITNSVPLYDVNDPRSISASVTRTKTKSPAFASLTPRFREEASRSTTPGPYYDIDFNGIAASHKSSKGLAAFRSRSPRFSDKHVEPAPVYEVRYPTDISVAAERRARQ
eukprot:TRINITY_DN2283_c0_g1_i1.p1 TRINITY_DN2283_c0_g1~~TRINITY_DN2283_c0_g1_i1.p1  ORF type:complete len:334 (-),score=29.66 TRINITY_DN2283_c0_g1_i1:252-1253(-)